MRINKKQKGLTLVELLVGMLISLVVLGGVYQIFASSSANYRMQKGLSRLQENGRFALYFLSKDTRLAGYFGCTANVTNFVNTLNTTDYIYDFSSGILGYEAKNGHWSPTEDSSFIDPLPGNDILTVRGIIGSAVSIANSMPNVSADLKTVPVPSGTTPPVDDGDIVMISDCSTNVSVFQITNYTLSNGNLVHNTGEGDPGNATKNLEHRYEKGAEIVKVATTSYFISNNQAGEPALYRKVGSSDKEEIVEGIETMQFLYGCDTDGDRNIDQYLSADLVTDWDQVLSVRVGLLMRTPHPVRGIEHDQSATFNVLGEEFGPYDDDRMRRIFTTTIGLRNRLR